MSDIDYIHNIFRYSSGETALMLVTSISANRAYGEHCMGGTHNTHFNDLKPASEKDLQTWNEHSDHRPKEGVGMTFDNLRKQNSDRCKEWNGDTPWTPADRVVELVGELGEAANVMKKLKRIKDGMVGTAESAPVLLDQLKDEIGDVQICLDLLADSLGIDLAEVTATKFNKTSKKVGFPHRL